MHVDKESWIVFDLVMSNFQTHTYMYILTSETIFWQFFFFRNLQFLSVFSKQLKEHNLSYMYLFFSKI